MHTRRRLAWLLLGFAFVCSTNASVSVVSGFPTESIIANPDDSPLGSSALSSAASNATGWKGNSFKLTAAATITSVTIQLDNSAPTDVSGSVTFKFYRLNGPINFGINGTAGNGPLPAVASPLVASSSDPDVLLQQTESITGQPLAASSYLQCTLNQPLNLPAGDYGFFLTTDDVNFDLELRNDGAYQEGELLRWNHTTAAWEDRANDLVFALGGASTFTLENPALWPATFLSNGPTASGEFAEALPGIQAGQSFTLAGDARLEGVVVQLDDLTSSPDTSGKLTLRVFAADASGLPIGNQLGLVSGAIPANATNGAFLRFPFSTPPGLVQGAYVLSLTAEDASVRFNTTSGDKLSGGTLLTNNGSGWFAAAPSGRDLIFGLEGTMKIRPPAGSGPNILFIVADDLGWTDLSTGLPNLGNQSDFYQTPNIDRLAQQGLCFRSAYVHQNCAPTRAAMISGQAPPRSGNGVYVVDALNRGTGTTTLTPPTQNEDVPASHYTLAEMLWGAGYVTCHVGKYHVGGHEGGSTTLPENQGYDFNIGGAAAGAPGSYFASSVGVFVSPNAAMDAYGAPYSAAYISNTLQPMANGNNPTSLVGSNKHLIDAEGDAVIDFIETHRSGSRSNYPFFLQYWSYGVHTPLEPRSDLKAKYAALPPGTRHFKVNYAALLEGLDQTVGRILNYLDATGLSSNTFLVFTSDNGGPDTSTVNTPLRAFKGTFFDGGLRVPMIVRQLGQVPTNQVTDTLIQAVDVFPTFMEAAAGSTTNVLDGFSFYQHALNPAANPRSRAPICYHYPGYLDDRARPCDLIIREVGGKRYKLIFSYDYVYDPAPADNQIRVLAQPWELYNLTDDISEATNLVNNSYWDSLVYGGIADALAADLRSWLTQSTSGWNPAQVSTNGVPLPFPPSAVPGVPPTPGQEFRITNWQRISPTQVSITFTSAAGYKFGVEASSNLSIWQALVTNVQGQAASTALTNLTDTGLTNSTRYYRSTVEPGS